MTTNVKTGITERIVIAGFGGQGVLSLGKMLIIAGMEDGKQVTYLPSYGAEVRGGAANCQVVISDHEIASPLAECPDSAMLFSQPSYDRFQADMRPGSCMLLNAPTVKDLQQVSARGVEVLEVPATKTAADMGNALVANLVMIGAYLAHRPVVAPEAFWKAFEAEFGKRKSDLMALNREAFEKGMEMGRR
ncbi:MAG TPA: 2-oxoacid:acceptor oxidoreductase family protein [Candidatus Brocadiia bacterium]|nr:2-oxoacid:acceptor oxidoreductase family protein [Candidatus Brocadiia bacterium]